MDDLAEEPLLLVSKYSAILMELMATYDTVNVMVESENGSVAVFDRQR